MKVSKRRWIILAVGVLLIAVLAAGAFYAARRGRLKKDLYARAIDAMAADDDAGAEKMLRTVLKAQPNHGGAFNHLTNLLWEAKRYDEYLQLCRDWVERGEVPQLGWRKAVTALLRLGRVAEAEAEARLHVEHDPALYHRVVMLVRNLSTDPRVRLSSVQAARTLAEIAEGEYQRASAYLTAAEILLDLADETASEQGRDDLGRLAKTLLGRAIDACTRGRRENPRADWIGMLAQINLRRNDEALTRAARDLLMERVDKLEGTPESVRTALVRHLIETGDIEKAKELTDGLVAMGAAIVPTTRLRLVQRWARANERAYAFELLDRFFPKPWPAMVEMLRTELLLAGGASERAEAKKAAETLIRTTEAAPAVVRSLLAVAGRAGQRELVLELLEFARTIRPDSRLDLMLVSALAGQDGESAERLAALAESMGDAGYSLAESGSAMLLLDRIDPEVLARYLDARIAKGGEAVRQHRILRARLRATQFVRSKTEKDSESLKESALRDLRALAESEEFEPAVADSGARIAVLLQDYALAGSFIAKAVGAKDSASPLASLLAATVLGREISVEAKGQLAAAMRRAGATLPGARFVTALSDWLDEASPDWDGLAARALAVADDASCSIQATYVAVSALHQSGRLDEAVEQASKIVAQLPDAPGAHLLYAAMLTRAERLEEAESYLSAREKPGAAELGMRVQVLLALDRIDTALEVARGYLRAYPADVRASLHLARVLLAKEDETAALAVLSAAPDNRSVALARAQLLDRAGRVDAALEIYGRLMARNALDREAVEGQNRTLVRAGRKDEALRFLDRYIEFLESRKLMDHPLRIQCLGFRGNALQGAGKVREALRDYTTANESGKAGLIPLNNGAWLLAERAERSAQRGTEDTEALEQANAWATDATRIKPDSSHAWDTAAYVDFVAGRHADALKKIDKALALREESPPDERDGSFRIRRARILRALGRLPDALEQLQEIEEAYPDTAAAKSASRLKEEFSKKN